jgi:hypothetical protein
MLNYERIKNIPTSRDGKMIYGIVAAVMARLMLNQGIATLRVNGDGAIIAFLMAGVLVGTVVLALVRYDTGRPLFEPLKRG